MHCAVPANHVCSPVAPSTHIHAMYVCTVWYGMVWYVCMYRPVIKRERERERVDCPIKTSMYRRFSIVILDLPKYRKFCTIGISALLGRLKRLILNVNGFNKK